MTPLLLLSLLACPGKPEGDSGEGDSAFACADTIALVDANNYSYAGSIDVPSLVTASGVDVGICWDEVVEDIRCHDVDPAADIDNVGLVRLGTLTQAEVEAALATDSLQQAAVTGYVESRNDDGGTCTNLASMSFFGTAIDVPSEYTTEGGTYMLLLTTGTTPGVGARMLAFLEPSAESDVTSVSVPSGCGALDFTVDVDALAPVGVCAEGPWEVDWGDLTTDGLGQEISLGEIDGLMIGYYEDWTAADLEANFLDLETSARKIWRLDLAGGDEADLSEAVDSDGAPFPGFTNEHGAWVLALTCSRCYSPAPPFLTLLEVR